MDINQSLNKINNLYDNLSYLDIYGSSVLIFILLTIIIFLIHSYCIVMINANSIKADWVNQRCNPKVIPFAGFINKPENKTVFDFTEENFNYCVQDILTNIVGYALQPITYLTNFLTTIFQDIQNSINTIRDFLANLRTKFSTIAQEILSRILNFLIPIQQIVIALKDSLNKVQSILTAGLYTSLGTYYTLQSFLGAIAQLIIEILIALAIIVVGLWILPFTWPTAAAMTAIFISISIPLTIIVLFMNDVLHVKSASIPGVPSCFDKNTLIKMNNNTFKKISDIEVGDLLENNNKVTSKMKLNSEFSIMYNLNNIIVSGTHRIKYNNSFIFVNQHPEIKIIHNYKESYLYCLNTTLKTIKINNYVFTDWDELYDEKLNKILNISLNNNFKIKTKENIHKYLDFGFIGSTPIQLSNEEIKSIQNIEIGDDIKNNVVYGLIEIDNTNLEHFDYLGLNKPKKIYHLLTYSSKFIVNSKEVNDYNNIIDFYLNK